MPAKRFYELDLLRFLAAFAVLLFHYSFRGYIGHLTVMPYTSIAPLTKYGFMGVNLFFLISGFVILMTAAGGSKRHFVVSRIVRLYPAFWVCCTATFLVLLAGRSAGKQVPTLGEYAVNMTMLSGFVGVPAVDNVYWSLFVEIKFYFLVYLTLLFGQIHRAKLILGVWLVAYVVCSVWPIKYVSYFLIPDYAPYFIAGAMFFLISREGVCVYKAVVIASCFVVAAMQSVAPLREMSASYGTQFSSVAVIVMLAVFFLLFFLIATGRTESLATRRWLTLGALTYPLYLLHQNIGFAMLNWLYGHVNVHVLMWGVSGAMLLFAYAAHRIERAAAKPMKERLMRLFARPAAAPAPTP